ncbi:MAG: hypothetical protein KatS3mg003_1075 [Candidatus Nitrosocaldaceae archaeon]|nr:MAG: hypothetical protein KatS3mg003_1075 [Candidatus Nitrosocaldaceae archaeon]
MNIIKEAHHSISIRRDQAKQFLMYMLEKGKNLEPIKLEKDSWMKVKKYELYAEKIEKSLTLKQKLQIAQEMNLDLDDPNVEEIIKKVATLKLLAMPYKQERIYTFQG